MYTPVWGGACWPATNGTPWLPGRQSALAKLTAPVAWMQIVRRHPPAIAAPSPKRRPMRGAGHRNLMEIRGDVRIAFAGPARQFAEISPKFPRDHHRNLMEMRGTSMSSSFSSSHATTTSKWFLQSSTGGQIFQFHNKALWTHAVISIVLARGHVKVVPAKTAQTSHIYHEEMPPSTGALALGHCPHSACN